MSSESEKKRKMVMHLQKCILRVQVVKKTKQKFQADGSRRKAYGEADKHQLNASKYRPSRGLCTDIYSDTHI